MWGPAALRAGRGLMAGGLAGVLTGGGIINTKGTLGSGVPPSVWGQIAQLTLYTFPG